MDRMGWFQMNYQKQMVDSFFSFFFHLTYEKIYTFSLPSKKKLQEILQKNNFE